MFKVLPVSIQVNVGSRMLRDQLRENVLIKQYYCDVDIAHLISFNEELAHTLTTQPAEIIPLVCCQPTTNLNENDLCMMLTTHIV